MANQRTPTEWTDLWMQMAHLISSKSKDPSFAAGSVLVKVDNKSFLHAGYNGPPSQVDDNFDWSDRSLKRSLCSHAESNSLWFAAGAYGLEALEGSILYVNGRCCSGCVKEMGRAKVSLCIYDDTNPSQPKMCDETDWKIAVDVAERSGMSLVPYSVFTQQKETKDV